MNKLLKGLSMKSAVLAVIFLISSVSVFAATDNNVSDKPMSAIQVIVSFALLLVVIIAPVFKSSERITFHK